MCYVSKMAGGLIASSLHRFIIVRSPISGEDMISFRHEAYGIVSVQHDVQERSLEVLLQTAYWVDLLLAYIILNSRTSP